MKTTWEANNWLTLDGKSSGQLYREYHFGNKNGKNISKDKVLKLDLSKLSPIKEDGAGRKTGMSFSRRLNKWAHSKNGKITLCIAGGAALLAGVGYAGAKSGWSNFSEDKKNGHLSCIG